MEATEIVRIESDRKGRKIALRFRIQGYGRAWWRMPLAEAELMLATGVARPATSEEIAFWSGRR